MRRISWPAIPTSRRPSARFDSYPVGTRARHSFQLNDTFRAVRMDELGSSISNLILPKLDTEAMLANCTRYRRMPAYSATSDRSPGPAEKST